MLIKKPQGCRWSEYQQLKTDWRCYDKATRVAHRIGRQYAMGLTDIGTGNLFWCYFLHPKLWFDPTKVQ